MIFRRKIVIGLHISKQFLQVVCLNNFARRWSFICAEQVDLYDFKLSKEVKRLFNKADIVCCSLEIDKEIVEFLHLGQKGIAQKLILQNISTLSPFREDQILTCFDKKLRPMPLHIILKKDMQALLNRFEKIHTKPNFIFSASRCLQQFLIQVYQLQDVNCLYVEGDKIAFLSLKSQKLTFYQSFDFENIFVCKQKLKIIFEEVAVEEVVLIGPDYKNKAIVSLIQDLGKTLKKVKAQPFGEMEFANLFSLAIGAAVELCFNRKWLYFNKHEFVDNSLIKRFQKQILKFSLFLGLSFASCFCFVNTIIARFENQIIASIESILVDLGDKEAKKSSAFWSNHVLSEALQSLIKYERSIQDTQIRMLPSPIHLFNLIEPNQSLSRFDYTIKDNQINLSIQGVKEMNMNLKNVHKIFPNLQLKHRVEQDQINLEIWKLDD